MSKLKSEKAALNSPALGLTDLGNKQRVSLMWRLKSHASDRTPDTEFPSQSDEHSPPSEGHMASAMAGTVVPKRSILGRMVPVSGARWGQRQLCIADFGDLLETAS